MPDRVATVVSKVLGIAIEQVDEDDTPATVKSWDSLAHINLTLALAAEFGVKISPEDAAEMMSIRAIRQVLRTKGTHGSELQEGNDLRASEVTVFDGRRS